MRRNGAVAVFESEAGTNVRRELVARQGLKRVHREGATFVASLRKLATSTSLPAEQRVLLRKAVDRFNKAATAQLRLGHKESARRSLKDDLDRFRANLRALNAGDAHERMTDKMLKAEELIESLSQTIRKLKADHKAHTRAAKQALAALNDTAK